MPSKRSAEYGLGGPLKRRRAMSYKGKTVKKSLAAKVNKLISQQERKNHDVAATIAAVGGTATIVQLSNIPQGDDAVSRDGRKVSYVSSHMRYTYVRTGTDVTTSAFRVIVLQDMQSNGLTPVVGDILTGPTNPRSPLTLDFKERFRVLHDNFCSHGKGDYNLVLSAGGGRCTVPGEYFAPIKDNLAQAEFGGIGSVPTTNSIILLFLQDGPATATADFTYYHRLRFTDS